MITWKDTIDIIKEMFEAKDKDIAECLEVSPQTFSNVKHRRRTPPEKFSLPRIYRKIFSLTESKSLASCDPKYIRLTSTNRKKAEDSCLSDLKKIIETKFPNARVDMDEFWNEEDYETFVMKLLKLANLSTPLKSTPKTSDAPSYSSPAQTDTCFPLGVFPVVRQKTILLQQEQSSVQIASSNDTTTADPPDTIGMGAQIHIEDKYKCCRFCANWDGTMKSTFAVCAGYQEPRRAEEGKECTYYEPNKGRITAQRTRSLLPKTIGTIKPRE